MSATIERYTLVDKDGHDEEGQYDTYDEALAAAGDDHAVVEHHYQWADSELVWTPDGASVWPPSTRTRKAKR